MYKKKILLTGSAGFIIGNLIRRAVYLKLPYEFVSIDKVNKNAQHSMYWNKNHTFHPADIRDGHIVDVIFGFEKPDYVIHGAAESSVDAAITDPNSFVSSNVLGTQCIINACIKYNVEKMLYLSTDEVMGSLNENDSSWTEESIPNPRNAYSASKYAGELMIKAANLSHGLNYLITRSSNNFGPRQTSDKLIPNTIKCILANEKIPVYGEGKQIRDWIHVFDNCDAIISVLEKGNMNEIYNISSNQEFSNIEVVQKICNAMNKGHDLISFVKDPRKSHDFRYSLNSNKTKALGWLPKYKLNDSISEVVNWYNNNQWYFK